PSSGYGYLTTRDGTKLAIYVHPPQDVSTAVLPNSVSAPPGLPVGGSPPYPTLIEYSGYGYARPPSEGGAESSIELLANIMGFTVAWAKDRIHDGKPAGPNTGQPWSYKQIQQGDETCKQNQVLHGEAANLTAKIRQNNHYIPSVADPLDPVTFVHKIHVPVFMACQWEDEQTGGHCPDLVEHM